MKKNNTNTKKKKTSKVRIYVDLFFFILMVLVLIPQTTGIPIHEWASFIILLPFFIHLIINWNWITTNSAKFLKKGPNKTRFDYILNWTLYILMIVITVSGIVISESALPLFGITFSPDAFWTTIHNASASLFMPVFGIHIALHWKWILNAIKKLKLKTDLHHLTELGSIIKTYKRQLVFLVVLTTILSIAFWFFNFSAWADSLRINQNSENHENNSNRAQSWMMYILPLVKVTVLTAIPALIAGGVLQLKNKFFKN